MKNLLPLMTLITLSCNPPSEPSVTYYNHDSTDGVILKIVSDDNGIISQDYEEAEWEKVSVVKSSYDALNKIGKKMERDKAKKAEAERIAFENWLNE